MSKQFEDELRVYTCCSSCALILGVIALAVNILAVQIAEDNESSDEFRLIYRWEKITYEALITDPETGEQDWYYSDFTYENLANTIDPSCSFETMKGVCAGVDDLATGGEEFVGLAVAAVNILFVANV